MTLELDAQGRCWEGTTEVFNLTEAQIDQLCDGLYPDDPVIRNQYMTAKRATSFTGSRFGFVTLVNDEPEYTPQRIPDEQIIAIGGKRLLAIYQANCVMAVAAAELGMREDALRRWFHRFKQADASQELRDILYEAANGTSQDSLVGVP